MTREKTVNQRIRERARAVTRVAKIGKKKAKKELERERTSQGAFQDSEILFSPLIKEMRKGRKAWEVEKKDGSTNTEEPKGTETMDGSTNTEEAKKIDGSTNTEEAKKIDGSTNTEEVKKVDGSTNTEEAKKMDAATTTEKPMTINAATNTEEAMSIIDDAFERLNEKEGSIEVGETSSTDDTIVETTDSETTEVALNKAIDEAEESILENLADKQTGKAAEEIRKGNEEKRRDSNEEVRKKFEKRIEERTRPEGESSSESERKVHETKDKEKEEKSKRILKDMKSAFTKKKNESMKNYSGETWKRVKYKTKEGNSHFEDMKLGEIDNAYKEHERGNSVAHLIGLGIKGGINPTEELLSEEEVEKVTNLIERNVGSIRAGNTSKQALSQIVDSLELLNEAGLITKKERLARLKSLKQMLKSNK